MIINEKSFTNMTNKALLEEIAKNASILDYHIKRLKEKSDQLHEIDIELLGDKLKEIYALIHSLTSSESGVPSSDLSNPEQETDPVPLPMSPEPIPEPDILDPEPEVINQEPKADPVPRPSSPEPIPEPDTPDPEPEVINQEPEADPVPRPSSPEPIPEPKTKTTADLFSGTTTIADSFQAEKDNTIAAIVNPQAVKDLKMVIGINDKFLFINELFQGDPAVYNQAIESFNVAIGPDEADQSMNVYREQLSWADNSEAYHRLKKIVKSKFNA